MGSVVNALAVAGSFFVPGLGQAMKGKFLRAIAWAAGFIIAVLLIAIVIGIVITPVVWAACIYDAYHCDVQK